MHHLLLQAARHVVQWEADRHPASVFVFRCQTSQHSRLNFDFYDHCFAPFVLALRFGGVGVIAVLQDWE